jgi:2-deoxy-D-gluconate 3-dehydrogenase|tara:strand:- start:48 stop:890 length:843 start_codon:yes stop_codon:yes gene_type:complete
MKIDHPYQGTQFALSGKVAVVTGGCGLLGKEFAKALSSAGASVVIGDINADKLSSVKDEIIRQFESSEVLSIPLDVTNNQSISEFIDQIEKERGRIDILVNSAAIDPKFEKGSELSEFTSFEKFPLTAWNESLEVNLTGAFQMTQAVCGVMEKAGKGSIINVGSNYGLVGPDQRLYKRKGETRQPYKPVVYSVCKAALVGFTKYLAAYYAGTEIRVNMLTPAGVFNNHEDEFVKKYSARTILGRMSEKEEYWGSIIFLASDASSYMTGSNLVVDGGWTNL